MMFKDCPECWHEIEDPHTTTCEFCGTELKEVVYTTEDWEDDPRVM